MRLAASVWLLWFVHFTLHAASLRLDTCTTLTGHTSHSVATRVVHLSGHRTQRSSKPKVAMSGNEPPNGRSWSGDGGGDGGADAQNWMLAGASNSTGDTIFALGNPADVAVRLTAVEPATGMAFSEGFETLTLVGTGVRTKTALKVKVYAVGLYVSEEAGDELAGIAGGASAEDLMRSHKWSAALKSALFDKALVLKMARTVGCDKMAGALEDSVKPRMKDKAALDEFKSVMLSAFAGADVATGTQLSFSISRSGQFTVGVNGVNKGVISSPDLCAAMMDVYVGDQPISEGAKRSFTEGLLKMFPQ